MLLLALFLAAADVHSLGHPEIARPTHVALDLTLDFERKVVAGSATLDLAYPLYQAMEDNPKTQDFGRRVYARARPTYHPIATASIDAILKPR